MPASVPADSTKTLFPSTLDFKIPSARGDLQILPRHTIKIFVFHRTKKKSLEAGSFTMLIFCSSLQHIFEIAYRYLKIVNRFTRVAPLHDHADQFGS